ncbi:MAG: ABC transporter ATP-binding protein/permease [Lachnospiraceae bacterium]|nr:ABC transporter ATP-binding protein/permease [Lachnospiraceae bacterium]
MLQLIDIQKTYTTGDFTQHALNGVSLNFRESEFVTILGQSGSGKTTMLNIIGGLDQYDKGDLVINGKSTKKYKDKDWDTYRNHSIGFVFQSYNLIPHQTVLSNVELALTLSGISKSERRARAKEVLEKVGLKDQMHKKPNQMSGGQMQRVAIARALINNPDILLADEPTGALDSETSVQIMELLKEIAKDRLIIMVTHNPELAEEYSNRIIRLRDGSIIDDTNPYTNEALEQDLKEKEEWLKNNPDQVPSKGRKKNTSMSFFTALSLSLNNLMTKKGRTIMTAFAGSIGIIGIALILSVSNGVQLYINQVQEDTLSSYPIMIESETVDMTSMMNSMMGTSSAKGEKHELDAVYSNDIMIDMMSMVTAQVAKNDLAAFKSYIESDETNIKDYLNAIQYGYQLDLQIFNSDTTENIQQVNPSTLMEDMGFGTMSGAMATMSPMANISLFQEMLGNDELLHSQYDVIAGRWPSSYDELVVVVSDDNEIADFALYALGLMDVSEVEGIMKDIIMGEVVEEKSEVSRFTYDEILNTTYKLVLNTAYYEKANNVWVDRSKDEEFLKEVVDNGIDLKIVGIIRPSADAVSASITGVIGYTSDLTEYVINLVNEQEIVKEQLANPNVDIFTGKVFEEEEVSEEADLSQFEGMDMSQFEGMDLSQMEGIDMSQMAGMDLSQMEGMGQVPEGFMDMSKIDLTNLSDEEVAYLSTLSEAELELLMQSYLGYGDEEENTYDGNLLKLGVVDLDSPRIINLYPVSFEAKESIMDIIETYNDNKIAEGKEEYKITFTDYVGIMMSSITTIIDLISYVLIAFVAISLVVSSIMIGIITYISVLERTKEIGILRSIGASKKDISRVFNAETLIVGFVAGMMGIIVTLLLLIPINAIIYALGDVRNLAKLPVGGAVILVAISMILTLIAGLIPSRFAAKKNPVEALRSE